ncbi:MAG: hypothetical protein WBN30_10570 [Polyangiales bacterium]
MRVGGLVLVGALLCGLALWVTREAEQTTAFGLSGEPGRIARGAPERAEKVLKVLESANAHNDRLDQMDERLFGKNASQ